MSGGLPSGLGVALSPRTHVCDDGRSLVGAGGKVLRLSPAAADVVARLPLTVLDESEQAATEATVARLLLDTGVADPWWPGPPVADTEVADVTVVIPTRDRPDAVGTLLASLPYGVPVIVVDDGSTDPAALAQVATAYGAHVERHRVNRGPAAARNTGLRAVGTPYVVFCDSDVTPEPGWLATLRRHLDDPDVALVGPRVLGRLDADDRGAVRGLIGRYEQARSSLDLGPSPALVRVHGAVAYLPSACLLARVEPLVELGGFEESMRSGEDVDLVWRLVAAEHRVRYEPAAIVRHDHRTGPVTWLARKAFYGTSAAALAARHPGSVAPMVATPWTVVWTVALLAQRRWSLPVAGLSLAAATTSVARRLRAGDRPLRTAAVLTTEGAVAATWQTGSALTRHYWPLAVVWAALSPRGRRALVVAAVAEGLADRRRVGSDQGAVAYVVAHRLDDLAYGAGLWWGCLRSGSARALLPVVRRRGARPAAAQRDREA